MKVFMKPLSSLRRPLRSVNLQSLEPIEAETAFGYRCGTCSMVVAEAMMALTLAEVALGKLGGDTLQETKSNYRAHT